MIRSLLLKSNEQYSEGKSNSLFCTVIFLFSFLVISPVFSQNVSWGSTGLVGEKVNNPTSLDFAPNGKLYVSQQNGLIWEYTIERDDAEPGNGTYTIVDDNTISLIANNTPNHNDDGEINSTKTRQITGILAAGTPENPILYVTSSDWRIGGKNEPGNDINLDTNSGILTRLRWDGNSWVKTDLVRGLPRCEENHSTNGMDLFELNGETFLFIQQGGNTNMGAPSNNFAGSSEYYLAGALLVINLSQLETMENSNGGPYTDQRDGVTRFIYDLPTLNDPEREDIDNDHPDFPYESGHPLYNATIDIGDPFGGNNGLNQAFSENAGPVQIFSPGYRNAYDVVVTENGNIYTYDNGPNGGWGGPPVIRTEKGNLKGDDSSTTFDASDGDYVTNEFNYSNGKTHSDQLHFVGNITDSFNSYYAGHPVPIRAFPGQAGVIEYEYNGDEWVESGSYDWADLISGVSGYFQNSFSMADFPDDPRQAEYTTDDQNAPGIRILDFVKSSTNGMCEYTASNFSGALKGSLLAASFNGDINWYKLNSSGNGLEEKDNEFLTGFGSIPLDVIAQGDDDIFPGTIWAATYGADDITVFEPADFGECPKEGESKYDPLADYDLDGFTNEDESLNKTDPCSAGSKPKDADGDFISDLMDEDDDNDGIIDSEDPFVIDPDNGLTTELPVDHPFWNNDPGTGFFGLGFTGLMLSLDSETEYLDLFDTDNMSFGGAGGKATVDETSSGTAMGESNNQEYAFQFGVNVDDTSNPFTLHGKIETPFDGSAPLQGQSYGIFLGNGDQDNFLMVAINEGTNSSDEVSGILIYTEDEGKIKENSYDIPGLTGAAGVDLYIGVNPSNQIAYISYSLDNGKTLQSVGIPVKLNPDWFNADDNMGLAVGIISTSGSSSSPFTATWDFLNVTEDQPNTLSVTPNELDFGQLSIDGSGAELSIEAINEGGAEDQTVEITAINVLNDSENIFIVGTNSPLSIAPGAKKQISVMAEPKSNLGIYTATLEIQHSGVNSPLSIPLKVEFADIAVLKPILRINAGGGNVNSSDSGPDWTENNFNGSGIRTNYTVNTGNVYNSSFAFGARDNSIPEYIDEATFDAIFDQERYDPGSAPEMEFAIPLENGDYVIRLYLGTSFEGTNSPGSRIFDILIENEIKVDNFDPVESFGFAVAGTVSIPATITDGVLNLSFNHDTENPNINAIEILTQESFTGVTAVIKSNLNSGIAPLEVTFDATGSSAVNGITEYYWNFGDGNTSSSAIADHLYESPGIYQVLLTVSDGINTDSASTTITVNESIPNNDFSLAINAGGPEEIFDGITFEADDYFSGGTTYKKTGLDLPAIYETERNANPPVFAYQIPVPNGNYTVDLHFAEIFFESSGKRIFDVYIENDLVLNDFDIVKDAGSLTAVIKSFVTTVEDGNLDLYFSAEANEGGVNRPKVSAIHIKGNGDQQSDITVAEIADQYDEVGNIPELSVTASGGSPEENFTYDISGQPNGISIESTNGQIIGIIEESALTGGVEGNGVHEVTITVSKPSSESVSTTFLWAIGTFDDQWTLYGENTNYTARSENSFVQAGEKFFLFGGRQSPKDMDVYNYKTDSWSTLPNSLPFDFNHVQAVSHEGLIWVMGGFQDNNFPDEIPMSHIWIFDPLNNQWFQGPEIPEQRRRGSAGVAFKDGKFYLIGGNTSGHNGGYVPWVDSYDTFTGEWTVLEDAPHARDHFQAVVYQNEIYAIAGRLSGGDGGYFAPLIPEVDVFDITTNSWKTLPAGSNIPTPRAGAAAALFQNKVYITGGEVKAEDFALTSTEVFEPVSGTWSQAADLNAGRHGTQSIVSGNGIFITGGSPERGGGSQKLMEFYNYGIPSGDVITESTLLTPLEIEIIAKGSGELNLESQNGNQAVFINDIILSGANPELFDIVESPTKNFLLEPNSKRSITINHLGTNAGDNAKLTITYNNSKEIVVDLNSVNEISGDDYFPVFRINAAGPNDFASTDDGPVWLANPVNGAYLTDAYQVNTGTNTNATFAFEARDSSIPEYIDLNTFQELFSFERYDPASGEEMEFKIPLPNGDYKVRLYLGNSFEGTSTVNSRVFDILIEGEQIINNFDPVATFGHKVAGAITSEVTLKDGELDIYFSREVENPVIYAVEILGTTEMSEIKAVATSNTESGTIPLDINFDASLSESDSPITTYLWDFGDGNSAEGSNVTHQYEQAGVFTVVLTITDEAGNTDQDNLTIFVNNSPESVTSYLRINAGGAEDLMATDQGPDWLSNPTNGLYETEAYSVNTGNNTTTNLTFEARHMSLPDYIDQNTFNGIFGTERYDPQKLPEMTFDIPLPDGDYQVNLFMGTSFEGTSSVGTRVFDIQLEGNTVIDNFDPVEAFGFASGGMLSLPVSVSDGILSISFIHELENPQVNAIEIMEVKDMISLEASLEAEPVQGYAPLMVTFKGSNSSGTNAIEKYNWDFGTGDYSEKADTTFTYQNEGTYQAVLKVTDSEGNQAEAVQEIIVEPAPELNARASADPIEGIAPLEVAFNSNESVSELGIVSYFWDFGDDLSTSEEANPTFTFQNPGEYRVILTIEDEIGQSDSDTLAIKIEPVNDIEAIALATPETGQAPLEIQFDGNASTSSYEITTYLWNFGDETTSDEINPIHTYESPGEYEAVLTVENEFGQSDSDTLLISVSPVDDIIAVITTDGNSGTAPFEVSFSAEASFSSYAITEYLWDFGDGTTSTEMNPTHTFKYPGGYQVKLTVTDEQGNTDTTIQNIVVEYPVNAGNIVLRINSGGPEITYSGNEFNEDIYFENGIIESFVGNSVPELYQTIRTSDTKELNYEIPLPNGTYNLVLHFIENEFSDKDGDGTDDNEDDDPNNDDDDKKPNKRKFDVWLENGLVLNDYDIFEIAGVDKPVKEVFSINVSDNNLNIDLSSLPSDGGKGQPLIAAIEVFGINIGKTTPPVALITASPLSGEVPLEVSFTGSTSVDDLGIASYSWDFGDGNTSEEADPVHTFTQVGIYEVTLTVTDIVGLTDTETISITVEDETLPGLVTDPAQVLDFGSVMIGDPAVSKELTLMYQGENIGTELVITAMEITGKDKEAFSLQSSLPIALEEGSSEPLVLDFTPNPLTGEKNAVLEITHNGNNSPFTIDLIAQVTEEAGKVPVLRLNAGSSELLPATDNGPDWEPIPQNGSYTNEKYGISSGINRLTSAMDYDLRHGSIPAYIDKTTFSELYSSDRYMPPGENKMIFTFRIPDGDYTVNLYIGNNGNYDMNDPQICDIEIEGNIISENINITNWFSSGQGGMLRIPATVNNGEMKLSLNSHGNSVNIYALELMGEDGGIFDPEEPEYDLQVSLYPNPASYQVTLTHENKQNPVTSISLFDISGRLMRSFEPASYLDARSSDTVLFYSLPLSGLNKGTYILVTESEDGTITNNKLVIERSQ
ncbi:malectin domain-containing carbohydrate-binding protein [Robertkochia aurantiaca]|uniref:malectin domain-containing carbohydrate-binding protein n=1 Tax=Robertkochia aurantiaca TaxID=2873700 RepID=UPI00272D70A0|nr:malectin domain-containing carbohydrate-binding protein [Robertkochia sp. 3YJGBD-33]